MQHVPFSYKVVVENGGNQGNGTVRVFLAPKFDERGLPLLFREQRKLFVELDKFSVSLKRGRNELIRQPAESSVIIPHEMTYRNLTNDGSNAALFNFCGCGWLQNMLIPKGSPEGLQCQLFFMISNGANDVVANYSSNNTSQGVCHDLSSYCGLLNARYPDARHMGYPFDRIPREGAVMLQQFTTPNMTVQEVPIKFTNRRVAPAKNSQSSTNKKRN